MAGVAAILRAVGRSLGRDMRANWSLTGNNFFIATAVFLQQAGTFVYLAAGLVMLFPLSADPLCRVPATRMALWPLDRRDRWALRAASPWVNPVTWLLAGLTVWAVRGRMTLGLWAVLAGLIAAAFLLSALPSSRAGAGWLRLVRPPVMAGQWLRKDLRGMLATLDLYCALLLTLSAVAYGVFVEKLPDEALVLVTGLVVLALSGQAQSLFGLDGPGGLTRYRLVPLRGWRILVEKNAAFLLAAVVLTLPLAPLSGLAAGLAALAVGHNNSVKLRGWQARWRFSLGGPFIMDGLVQSMALVTAAWSISTNAALLLLWMAAWALSTAWYGRELDKALRDR